MRKLTAGIFSVLLGLVSVGGANAAVVSTEYLSEVLQTELAKKQDTLTIDGEVIANSNNLVTSGAVSTAISAANTNITGLQTTVAEQGAAITNINTRFGDMNDAEKQGSLAYSIAANATNIATNTGAIAKLNGTGDGSVSKAVADAKSELQGKIDLKANIADVYSKTEAEAKFEAQAAATAKLQAAKDYTDEQLKTLTEDMWGGGEGSEDQGLQGTVASQALKITALEDKVGDKSVVARIAELDSPDTAVEKQFVTAVSENDGVITVSRRALAAADIPVIAVSQVDGLQAALDAKQVNLTGQDSVIVIADGVVSIAAQGIGTEQLKDGSVTAGKIADGAITKGKIAADAIESGNIVDGAITSKKIGEKAVGSDNIADNAVGTNQLADSVNSLLTGAIQAPTSENTEGTFVLTAKKITGTDGKVTYSYAWEDIAGRSEE